MIRECEITCIFHILVTSIDTRGPRKREAMSQWVKLADEQGELVRKLKEEIKADPASHPKEELDAAVAKLKELKAKADDPMNALEDPVTKVLRLSLFVPCATVAICHVF